MLVLPTDDDINSKFIAHKYVRKLALFQSPVQINTKDTSTDKKKERHQYDSIIQLEYNDKHNNDDVSIYNDDIDSLADLKIKADELLKKPPSKWTIEDKCVIKKLRELK